MRLPIFSASSRSWLTKTMVFLSFFWRSRSSSWSLSRISGSSAENGSSMSRIRRIGGEGAGEADALLHAAGKLVRSISRPSCDRPTSASFSSTIRFRSAAGMPRTSRPKPTFSRTVRQGSSANCWNTMATARVRSSRSVRSVAFGDVDRLALMLDDDRAAGDRVEPVDGAEHGRLAGAGEAHQHADLAALDGEVDVDRAEDAVGRWR